jgi:uncharacterized protein (TIGR02466 family)
MGNQVDIINAHGPYIFKIHYDFDFQALRPLCHELMNSSDPNFPLVENGGSTHQHKLYPHNMPEFRDFFQWLKMMATEIAIRGMGYSTTYHKYSITNSWLNVHYKGGKTHAHNHSNTFMAAAAYLNMPENGGYFECKDPLEDLKGFYYHDTSDWMWREIPVISGDVLIFPGWLKHRTQPNNSDEERWVLTTNFEQEFNKDGNYYKPKYSTNS